jgi:Orotate phosphoribosyltransferase
VFVDREQGGREFLEERGFRLFPVFTLKEWLDLLVEKKKINKEKYEEVINFINNTKIKIKK